LRFNITIIQFSLKFLIINFQLKKKRTAVIFIKIEEKTKSVAR